MHRHTNFTVACSVGASNALFIPEPEQKKPPPMGFGGGYLSYFVSVY
jgi:hypothetical protein